MMGAAKTGFLRTKGPPPSVVVDDVFGDDINETITVSWTGSNMPAGHYYKVVWTINSGGTGGGTVNPATSAQVLSATDVTGATNATITVEAYNSSNVLIASNTWGPSLVPI